MSLIEIIMAEHSKAQAKMIADIIIQEPVLLGELMEIIFSNTEPASRRAAWPLRFIHNRDLKILLPYFPLIVEELPGVESVAVQRSLLYILAYSDIPEDYHGQLLQFTSQLLTNRNTSVASTIYSMDIFFKLSLDEPDLLFELKNMLEMLMPYGSAGVKSKSRRIIKKIEKLVGYSDGL